MIRDSLEKDSKKILNDFNRRRQEFSNLFLRSEARLAKARRSLLGRIDFLSNFIREFINNQLVKLMPKQ